MALGFMRRHRKWLFGFLWLVIAAFIILYIPAFQGAEAEGAGAPIISVGDQKVTVGEYQRAYVRQREMYQSIYQGRLDEEALRRMGLPEQTLQALVDERILLLEARRLGIVVDDDAVRNHLATAPDFQVDGRFMGAGELRRRLDMRGITEEEFVESLRRDLLRRKVVALLTDGVMVTPAEAEQEFRRRTEQVRAEYVLVPADTAAAPVSDEEVKSRFESDKERWKLPERRVVEYLLVDVPSVQSRAAVTEADERAYYEANREQFSQPEEVCASHFLVKVKSSPEAAEGHPDAEARALAQAGLEQVKGGADFATVAKKVSEDEGSGSQGGDLGCFPRGRMVPEFENAAFDLEAGRTSDLVKTAYGYHVIRVNAKKPESTLEFTQVRDRIKQTVTGTKVRTLVQEAAQRLSEALRGGRSLEEAGRAEGLTVKRSPPFPRAEPPPPLPSPELVSRAFEMKRGETESDPFGVTAGYAFISVAEIQAPRVPDFTEVKDRVRTAVQREKAFARARDVAREVRRRAETSGLDKAAQGLGLVRKETQGLVGRGQGLGDMGTSAGLEHAVFALPENTLSEPLDAPSGVAVVRVLERKAFDPAAFEKEKAALVASLREERRQELFRSYMGEARRRNPVQRHVETFRRVITG
jgi:peptidyl-prolyl cis-trans isomerase D